MKLIPILLAVFANLWWLTIARHNPLLALVLTATTLLLIARDYKKATTAYFVILFAILSLLYIRSTTPRSLTVQDNDDKRIEAMRMRAHPPVYVSFEDKKLWIPTAWWLEGRAESRVLYRIHENVTSALDINLYFFASHPRSRVGVDEFEKYPYILLPFFFVGVYVLSIKKRTDILLVLLFVLMIFSAYGILNPFGPFLMFPLISYSLYIGVKELYSFISRYHPFRASFFSIILFVGILLNIVQLLLYEK